MSATIPYVRHLRAYVILVVWCALSVVLGLLALLALLAVELHGWA